MRAWLFGLLLAAPLAFASEGSWSSQSFGGTITRGQQKLKSRPVQPSSPLPKGAAATRLAWKINTDRPTPMGFRIQFCGGNHCVPLPTLSGERDLPKGFPAAGPYRFEYFSTLRGVISPSLTILSNQITVGYK